MTTLTLVSKTPIATQQPRVEPLLGRFFERVVRLPWPGDGRVDATLARAIEEAFESLGREARG
jgi:hypothetical protein